LFTVRFYVQCTIVKQVLNNGKTTFWILAAILLFLTYFIEFVISETVQIDTVITKIGYCGEVIKQKVNKNPKKDPFAFIMHFRYGKQAKIDWREHVQPKKFFFAKLPKGNGYPADGLIEIYNIRSLNFRFFPTFIVSIMLKMNYMLIIMSFWLQLFG